MKFVETNENRMYSDFQRKGRIRKCFFCDTDKNIISSHSISEKKCLSLLAENVKGQKGVYSFKDIKWSWYRYFDAYGFGDFETVGIKQASTFRGFCSCHDQNLFKLIDDNAFDPLSKEQCFLYCYRAFAHTVHSKKEERKRCYAESEYKQFNYADVEEEGANSELCLNTDIVDYPNQMNNWLKSRDYENLYHFHFETSTKLPIATSSFCSPPFTIFKNRINDYRILSTPLNHVFINIIPEESKTHILISAFNDQPKAIQFIEELKVAYETDKNKMGCFLTAILIFHVENTFVSPSLIDSLPNTERRNLLLNLKSGAQENLFNRYVSGCTNLFKGFI